MKDTAVHLCSGSRENWETEDGNLKELLLPYPADEMRMWEISPRVNSPKNDDPSLWEPLHSEPTQTTTHTLELLRE
jgi:putative SOS response-associated peptidase YedK